jgi:hypothetical protein
MTTQLTLRQKEIIKTIIFFYDHPWMAKREIQKAVDAGHFYFSSEAATERFLRKEKLAHEERKHKGVKSPTVILTLVLEERVLPVVSEDKYPPFAVGIGIRSAFEYLVWQERVGRWT